MPDPLKLIIAFIGSFSLLIVIFFLSIINFQPSVEPISDLTPNDIARIKKNISNNNPFEMRRSGFRTMIMDEKTLNQAANFTINNIIKMPVSISLNDSLASVKSTLSVPNSPIPLYLNTQFNVTPYEKLFKISDIKIGIIPIPNWLVKWITPYIMQYTSDHYSEHLSLLDSIKKIIIDKNRVQVLYFWNYRLVKKVQTIGRDFLLSPEEQTRVAVYYEKLGKLSRLYFWRKIKLNTLLNPLAQLAQKRSEKNGSYIEENRAMLLAMGLMSTGMRANILFQESSAQRLKYARFYRLQLNKRRDLLQHFLVSAALTVSTNQSLTDAIGVSKELEDADGGSGFSFADLLADKAGIQFGQMAINSESSAMEFQKLLLRKNLDPKDFMPDHKNLPESISKLEFEKRFIDITHPKYEFVEREINKRIGATLFFAR